MLLLSRYYWTSFASKNGDFNIMCFAIVSATDIVLSKKIFKPVLFTIYSRKKTSMSDMRTKVMEAKQDLFTEPQG